MNVIAVARVDPDEAMMHRPAPELLATVRSPATLVNAEGAPLLITVGFPGDLAAYRRALRAYPMDTTVRAGGVRNVSRTFGFAGRMPLMQRNSCRACTGALSAPEPHAVITTAAAVLAGQLAELAPERAAADRALVEGAVLPAWRLPGAWWTSGVVNRTSPLPYHRDRNNFDAWSAMVVVRRAVRGGYLHIPELGAVVECRDGDVVYFNGNDLIHGVTPMRRLTADGYRYSAVYYPVARMANCLEPSAELARGRASRAAAEDDLIARQRKSGALTSRP